MSRLIDGDALYERACDLEAQALSHVGKIANDETKIEEWRIWSAILVERTAFKHDVLDAHTIAPERKKGKWMPDNTNYYEERYICLECGCSYKVDTCMGKPMWNFCPNCGADMRGGDNGQAD